MSIENFLEKNLETILDIARFAPSVHNTQPWIVTLSEDTIVITIDPTHRLQDGDPTGRETIISLGIFAEAISIAAQAIGLDIGAISLKDEICTLSFIPGTDTGQAAESVELLQKRCSDRSIYKHTDLTPLQVTKIRNARQHQRLDTLVITEDTIISKVAKLTGQGIQLALSSPGFRRELSEYLVVPGSSKKRGISTKSLYIPKLLQYIEPWLIKAGISVGAEAKLERERWQSASGIVFICAEGDMHSDWFEVGRTYLQVSLVIEALSLSQATSASIVEASNFHEDIEEMLGTSKRIQAVIRIGAGKKSRYSSPRVSARDLMATSS